MDLYTFVVEDFIIRHTRSVHNDTLHLSHSAFVDGDLVASSVHLLGDFDNGEYSTVDYVPSDQSPGLANVVMNNPQSKTAFIFQLVNAGHVSQSTAVAGLSAAASKLKDVAGGLAAAGATAVSGAVVGTAFPPGLVIAAFNELWSWASQDTDGPIAADLLSGPRYVIDAWTDNGTQTIRTQQEYFGTDSPIGTGGDSDYLITWSLRHHRTWTQVTAKVGGDLVSDNGLAAATHHGGVHVFGVTPTGEVTHARTFTGAVWAVDSLGNFPLLQQPVSAISFNDRLLVFGVDSDAKITSLARTTDGGTWVPFTSTPADLTTKQPVALAELDNRLCLLARDAGTQTLQIAFTPDVRRWTPWAVVPDAGLAPKTAVAAATLDGTLYLFGLYVTNKTPGVIVVVNSSTDGTTWSGWSEVEGGVRPEQGLASDVPLDVAATSFEGQLQLAVRWETDNGLEVTHYVATNTSRDGKDWSGWRIPDSDKAFAPSSSAAVAGTDGHLYILSAWDNANIGDTTHVWSY